MKQKIISSPYLPGILLFIVALVAGLLVYQDYGVAWDEPIHRGVGRITYQYVFANDPTLKTYEDRALGTGFELPLIFMEKWLGLKDIGAIWFARHLITHIFFLISVFCAYVLAYRLFRNRLIACLAFLLLVLHPRIYAHSFFNSKDIPFLSAFLVAMLFCEVAFEKDKTLWYLLLGMVCGYATSIRAMGILWVPCVSVLFIADLIFAVIEKRKISRVLLHLAGFLAGFNILLYLAWPVLWSNPIHYFREEFATLSHISWTGTVLFKGKMYAGDHLPWNYLPVWFSITMPELWLAAGLTGLFWIIISFFKTPVHYLRNRPERNFLLYIVFFIGPVMSVVALNAVNYDDWRHLYFIYPAFVMLVLFALNKLLTGEVAGKIIKALCAIQIAMCLFFIASAHPFQQVYFNYLVSHDKEFLRKNYDMEYWGCAFKQGLEHILSLDRRPVLRISRNDAGVFPLNNNVQIITEPERKRIEVAEPDKADYFITNYRLHPEDYPYTRQVYSVQVLNSTILAVYRLQ